MSNGNPQTDREVLIKIQSNVEHIKDTQDEKFKVIFDKLKSDEKRIKDVEQEQGVQKVLIAGKPSAGKIITWVAVIISIVTGLGVYANSFIK